jgi:hypothetical protein
METKEDELYKLQELAWSKIKEAAELKFIEPEGTGSYCPWCGEASLSIRETDYYHLTCSVDFECSKCRMESGVYFNADGVSCYISEELPYELYDDWAMPTHLRKIAEQVLTKEELAAILILEFEEDGK